MVTSIFKTGLDKQFKIEYTHSSFRCLNAVKRRVEEERNRRESRLVGRDMEGFFEYGLGAAHRPYVFRK